MHRSGTSLAANVIQSFGVPMGQSLLPANQYNKWGYFEDTEVVKIHNQLLTDLQRPWGSVRHTFPMPNDWLTSKAAGKARKALTAYLKKEIAAHKKTGIWAVKDPRISLFLPLWAQITKDLDVQFKQVLCFRNVEAVAASLLERDNLPRSAGRLLWLQYCAQAVTHLDTKTTHVLRFETWQSDAQTVFEQLRSFCEMEPNDVLEPPFQYDQTRVFPNAPEGVFAQWAKAIEATDKTHKISTKLKSLAREHVKFMQVTRVWPRYLDDEVVQKQMSARLEQDLEVYRVAHDKLSAESTELAKQAAARLAEAEEDVSKIRAAYDALVDTAASHQKAYEMSQAQIEAINAQLVETRQQHKQSLIDIETYQTAFQDLREERDQLLTAAQENLTAYQTVDDWLYAARKELSEAKIELETSRNDLISLEKKRKAEVSKSTKSANQIKALTAEKDAIQQQFEALEKDHLAAQEAAAARVAGLEQDQAALQDSLAAAGKEHKAAQKALSQEIDDLKAERDAQAQAAQENLAAYEAIDVKLADLQIHADDLAKAHKTVQAERDAQAQVAKDNLAAYQEIDVKLADLQSHTDDLAKAYEAVQAERDEQAQAARDNLAAYQAIDLKLADLQTHADDLAQANEGVTAERDDALREAQKNLQAWQAVEAQRADLQTQLEAQAQAYAVLEAERDAKATEAQDNFDAYQSATDEATRLRRWHIPSMAYYVFTGFGLFSSKSDKS